MSNVIQFNPRQNFSETTTDENDHGDSISNSIEPTVDATTLATT